MNQSEASPDHTTATTGDEHKRSNGTLRMVPLKLKLGPIDLGPYDVPLAYLVSFLIGLVVGVGIISYSILSFQQPRIVIDPVISKALSTTMATQPTDTPEPSATPPVSLEVLDTMTRNLILPQGSEYHLRPGQRVHIQIVPAYEAKKYRWDAIPPEGAFEPTNQIAPMITYIAPVKTNKLPTVIKVCEANQQLECLGGTEHTIVVRTIPTEE